MAIRAFSVAAIVVRLKNTGAAAAPLSTSRRGVEPMDPLRDEMCVLAPKYGNHRQPRGQFATRAFRPTATRSRSWPGYGGRFASFITDCVTNPTTSQADITADLQRRA